MTWKLYEFSNCRVCVRENFEAPHAIDWNSMKVLDKSTSQTERRVREALHICKRKPVMNRDQGVEVSNVWKTTV